MKNEWYKKEDIPPRTTGDDVVCVSDYDIDKRVGKYTLTTNNFIIGSSSEVPSIRDGVIKNIISAHKDVENLMLFIQEKMLKKGKTQVKKNWIVESSSKLQCHFGLMMTQDMSYI